MDYDILLEKAKTARSIAYAPYSHFAVGAALLCADGTVYTGCNIENATYTPTCCAERVAIHKAVSDNKRDFIAIAIAGGKEGNAPVDSCPPCGVCRQVMLEFCSPDTFNIILGSSAENMNVHKLGDMIPLSFGPENLNQSK